MNSSKQKCCYRCPTHRQYTSLELFDYTLNRFKMYKDFVFFNYHQHVFFINTLMHLTHTLWQYIDQPESTTNTPYGSILTSQRAPLTHPMTVY